MARCFSDIIPPENWSVLLRRKFPLRLARYCVFRRVLCSPNAPLLNTSTEDSVTSISKYVDGRFSYVDLPTTCHCRMERDDRPSLHSWWLRISRVRITPPKDRKRLTRKAYKTSPHSRGFAD